MKLPGFVGPSYESQSRIAAGELLMNLYPEVNESEAGISRASLYPAPGLSAFAELGEAPGRAIFGERGRLFGIGGGTVNEVAANGAVTPRGAVAVNASPATLSTNGDGGEELFITSGNNGYILDLITNVLTNEVSDVTMGGQIDGFFVALDANSSTLKISESLDGKTWDGTQIAQRTAASDPWTSMIVSRREIFLFGSKTGEVWFNAGNSPFPFAQRQGAVFDIGIAATFSLSRFGNTMAWLGQSAQGSGIVYWMNGYTPNRISNHAVEWAIQQYKDHGGISDAIGWSYESQGHSFYVLTFPTQAKTWVYDATTGQWHQRGKWSSISNDFIAYRPQFHAQMFDKNIVCDSQGGTLYALSSTVYVDSGGEVLRRVRRTPSSSNENKKVFYHSFELEAEAGVGLVAGQGSDPQVMLRYSNDGGQTWGVERDRSLGKSGAYNQRVKWDQCGSGRKRVWEVSCSDPVPVRLFDAYVSLEAGLH